jgi:gluconate kinase
MPVLVVTGAAATGKSTVCANLAGHDGLLALDGDVLARGAAAVTGGHRDYDDFWTYLLSIAREVHMNGLVPVFACVCLPDQVVRSRALSRIRAVHFLALLCDETESRRRILNRPGAMGAATRVDFHVDLNNKLATAVVAPPHTFTTLDTTNEDPQQTSRTALDWALHFVSQ